MSIHEVRCQVVFSIFVEAKDDAEAIEKIGRLDSRAWSSYLHAGDVDKEVVARDCQGTEPNIK